MQNVMVRIEIDPSVAVRQGSARAGRGVLRVYRAEIRREIERLRGAADAA